MSDNNNGQQQEGNKKHDPAVALRKIKDFLGTDVTERPKLTRDVLDDILDEMSAEAEVKLKEDVKTELKGIIADNQKLKQAKQEFQKLENEVGKSLNERLNKLASKVERHTQDKKDLNDTMTAIGGVSAEHLESTTATETPAVNHTFNTDGQS